MMEATTFEIGKLIQDVPYESYAAAKGLRASELKLIKASPAHLVAALDSPRAPTEALEFGRMFHLAMENGQRFLDSHIVLPYADMRTNKGKDLIAEFMATKVQPHHVVVPFKHAEPLLGMLRSAMGHRLVGRLLKDGIRETSLWVEDPDTGLLMKCRPDFLSARGQMVDLKTTRCARPSFFMRQIYSDTGKDDPFYVLQAAHYAHCARLSRQCNGESLIFVAIEKEAPYGIMVYPLDEGAIEPGELWRKHLARVYAKCVRENKWPCYDEKAQVVFPPQWVSEAPAPEFTKDEVGF